jgi:hypothetical protein
MDCGKFRAQIDRDAERIAALQAELYLVREAALDESLDDGAARAVARGLAPVTKADVEWAKEAVAHAGAAPSPTAADILFDLVLKYQRHKFACTHDGAESIGCHECYVTEEQLDNAFTVYESSRHQRLTPAPPGAAGRPERRIVQQVWTWALPLRMQSLLMLAMRGPDGCSKENGAKVLLRELRSVVLVPAFPGKPDSFMGLQKGFCDWDVVETFAEHHDEYPHHWLMHFIHAAEVVGQFHPDHHVQSFWWNVYVALCHAMHMHNENLDELLRRLGDPEPPVAPHSSDGETA